MLRRLNAVLVAAVCAMTLIGCVGSGGQGSSTQISPLPTIEPPKDVLIEHAVFLSDETDTYSEYVVVYYGSDTHTLKEVSDEIHFLKSAGYTRDQIESLDIDQVFNGFSKLSFASKTVTDDDDHYSLVCRFEDLDEKANLLSMHNGGILELDSTDVDTVDADSVIKHLSSEGYKELQLSEYANVGLHFQ
ncbi:MAG: hypothetical protein Q4A93_00760 [Actinomycetota bacterium]|nr:hypothetical protein [Actinomycetota bacterium]